MCVEELDRMLADVERIERFIDGHMSILPTETKEKADAAEAARHLKDGVLKLKGVYQGKKESLQKVIDKRRAS